MSFTDGASTFWEEVKRASFKVSTYILFTYAPFWYGAYKGWLDIGDTFEKHFFLIAIIILPFKVVGSFLFTLMLASAGGIAAWLVIRIHNVYHTIMDYFRRRTRFQEESIRAERRQREAIMRAHGLWQDYTAATSRRDRNALFQIAAREGLPVLLEYFQEGRERRKIARLAGKSGLQVIAQPKRPGYRDQPEPRAPIRAYIEDDDRPGRYTGRYIDGPTVRQSRELPPPRPRSKYHPEVDYDDGCCEECCDLREDDGPEDDGYDEGPRRITQR